MTPESSGDSIIVKLGRAATIHIKPRWLPPAALAAVLGVGGIAYQQGVPAEAAAGPATTRAEAALVRIERRLILDARRRAYDVLQEARTREPRDRVLERGLRDEIRALDRELEVIR